jgi:hypothetical protein
MAEVDAGSSDHLIKRRRLLSLPWLKVEYEVHERDVDPANVGSENDAPRLVREDRGVRPAVRLLLAVPFVAFFLVESYYRVTNGASLSMPAWGWALLVLAIPFILVEVRERRRTDE